MICKRLNCRFWSCIAKATSPQWDERIVVPHCWNLNIRSRSNLIWVDDSNKWSEWKRKAGTGEGFRYSRTNRRRNEFDRISGGNQNYFHCDCFQQNWHNPCHHFYHPHLHPSHHLYPHQSQDLDVICHQATLASTPALSPDLREWTKECRSLFSSSFLFPF